MKNPFQRHLKDGQISPSPIEQFITALDKHKHRVADFINAQLAKLSRRNQRRLLLVMGLLITGLCIGLIVQAYNGGPDILKTMRPAKVIEPNLSSRRALRVEERQLLRDFQLMMDSLERSPYGKEIYEEIKRQRPGLLDTVNMLLKIPG
jgi:hypothetical protein